MAYTNTLLSPRYQAVFNIIKQNLGKIFKEREKKAMPYLVRRLGMSSGAIAKLMAEERERMLDELSTKYADLIMRQQSRQERLEDIASARKEQTKNILLGEQMRRGAEERAFERQKELIELQRQYQKQDIEEERKRQRKEAIKSLITGAIISAGTGALFPTALGAKAGATLSGAVRGLVLGPQTSQQLVGYQMMKPSLDWLTYTQMPTQVAQTTPSPAPATFTNPYTRFNLNDYNELLKIMGKQKYTKTAYPLNTRRLPFIPAYKG